MNLLDIKKSASARILEIQNQDGAILWTDRYVFDPWNHVEAAMGLTVAGELTAARRAFQYLKDTQNDDGSWSGEYGATSPVGDDQRLGAPQGGLVRDTNFAAYIAVGVWHYYLCTNDLDFLLRYQTTVERALGFVLSCQSPHGDIRFAASDDAQTPDDALVTGCSSIYFSLEAAIRIAQTLDAPTSWIERARARLGAALRDKPHRFDRTWPSKEDFAMDWYYPVLTGALTGEPAKRRIRDRWSDFVEEDRGCRCLRNSRWITTAESCELVLTLLKIGEVETAERLFALQVDGHGDANGFWMGSDAASGAFWPQEKPSWTSAAVLLALDALNALTPACDLFTSPALPERLTIKPAAVAAAQEI